MVWRMTMSRDLQSIERLLRSKVLGTPFVLTKLMTRFEIFGREHLHAALERRRRSGCGLVTFSNHQSLFDDPLVIMALLDIDDFTVESKCWWSTPCQSNFYPDGKSLGSRFVRYFSDVSNMVFISRKEKNGRVRVPTSYLSAFAARGDSDFVERLLERGAEGGTGAERYLRRFVTDGDREHLAPLNQLGMVEACARVDLGDWLHFFPEGGRSRTTSLRPPKPGLGKVLYHCEGAEILPICFCGMQDVLPIKAAIPRPLRRVVVFVGEPVQARRLEKIRRGAASPESYLEAMRAAWEPLESLWPLALARYSRLGMQIPTERPLEVVERPAEHATGAQPAKPAVAPREVPLWARTSPRSEASSPFNP
jgi:1-acyl-sn-glycerol-3-phosphate acyltransferase